MDFLEFPSFPEQLTQHIVRGICFLTEVVVLASGHEQRNAAWSYPLRRYELTAQAHSASDCYQLEAFFQAVRGRSLAFRFKDPLEHCSAEVGQAITPTDQWVGKGDGIQRAFQLIKTRRVGESEQKRIIQKPILHSVVVAVGGIEAKDLVVNPATGVITFLEPPPRDTVISAGFAFDVPCRFDSDHLAISLQPPHLGSVTCTLLEVRLPVVSLDTALPEIQPEIAT